MSNLFSFNFSKLTHDFLGKRGVLPRGYNAMMNEFALHVCTNVIGEAFCTGTIFMVCGSDIDGVNTVSEKIILPQEVLF